MSLYNTLGIDMSASKEDIKKAYRRKAMHLHPDKGGNPTDFLNLQKAYLTLIDDSKRSRYDKDGSYEDPFVKKPPESDPKVMAYQLIRELLNQILLTPEEDILGRLKTAIPQVKDKINQELNKLKETKRKLLQLSKRLRKAGTKKNDPFMQIINEKLSIIEQQLKPILLHKKTVKEAEKIITGYKDDFVKPEPEYGTSIGHGSFNEMFGSFLRQQTGRF